MSGIGILPGTSWGGEHVLDPQARRTLLKPRAIHGTPVPEQVLRRSLPGKGLGELLRRPPGRRMLGHVEVDRCPSGVAQHDQHEEDLEADRGDGEEIEGDDLRQVILQEDPPGGKR